MNSNPVQERRAALGLLREQVLRLGEASRAAERVWAPRIARVHPENSESAVNLAHYWAVRQHDLRDLQPRLAELGLSSLGRSESHVRASLAAVLTAIDALAVRDAPGHGQQRGPDDPDAAGTPTLGFADGHELLRRRAVALLGPAPAHRHTRIMVTLPGESAQRPEMIGALAARGMDLARINCAHDDERAWAVMIDQARRAGDAVGRDIRVAMDLGGPKLRTGPLAAGPPVVRLRPERDALGRVLAPAHCRLTATPATSPEGGPPAIPVPADWLARRRVGEVIELRDTRDARRRLLVEHVGPDGVSASCDQTVYLGVGTKLRAPGKDSARVGPLPPTESRLTLRVGDRLVLTRDCSPAPLPGPGEPARIGCTLPAVFDQARPGQAVYFDDGRIGGEVTRVRPAEIEVRITQARPNGSRLRGGKGVNLPDTTLRIPALTDQDREHLDFVAKHADLVELSFVRDADDVADLLSALEERGDQRLGVVVKVETAPAFENLPEILLTAMGRPRVGVMIARGDLAVECGYQRLVELQEEILWLAESAHIPTIWATQVLDQLARSGTPSRAEVTDAAMGARAECVMLNKGPHVVDAVATLDNILRRMTSHLDKKDTLMRSLRSWRASAGT